MSLIQMSLSGAVMILVIAALRAFTVNRLPKRTFPVLWGIVLVRLLLPYSAPSSLSVYSMINRLEPVQEKVVTLPPILFEPQEFQVVQVVPSPAPVLPAEVPATAPAAHPVNVWAVLWLLGAAACLIWFAVSYFRCRREFQTSLPVQNDYIQHWLKTHKLRRSIEIRQSGGISAPLTYGVLRPVILVPKGIDWDDIAALRYVLEHEYIHIRRFDAAAKLIFTAALCIHWFNPAVWLMYFLVNRDMELSCDEAVIHLFGQKSKSNYAMTLIHMEETKSSLMPLANGFSKNAIEERITAIMKTKKITLWVSVIALVLVAGTAILFATSPKEETPDLPAATHTPERIEEIGVATAAPVQTDGLLDEITMILTPNITRERVTDTRENLVRDGQVIGGIVVIDLDREDVNDSNLLVEYLQSKIVPGVASEEYGSTMGGSGKYCLAEYDCGTRDREFSHCIYQGESAFYDVWFEYGQLNTWEKQVITASLRSNDILSSGERAISPDQVTEISFSFGFDNAPLPGTDGLQALWDAMLADIAAGTAIPDAGRHDAWFHSDENVSDHSYVLLTLSTDVDVFTFQVYPECENVMAWMAQRNVLEERGYTVVENNWDVAFKPTQADATHVTLQARLISGHACQLQMEYTMIAGSFFLENPYLYNTTEIPLGSEGTTEVTIDWSERLGSLPAGDYRLKFHLRNSPPDTNDRQVYSVEFTIPE